MFGPGGLGISIQSSRLVCELREERGRGNMAFRDLVMGGAGCAVPGQDGSSSSNPLGGLADSIIGSASKTQVSSVNGEFRVIRRSIRFLGLWQAMQ